MGQVFVPAIKDIILTDVDRLVARNADGGLNPNAAHIILLGQAAGQNLGDVDNIIALGAFALDAGVIDTTLQGTIAIGVSAASALTSVANVSTPAANIVMGENALAAAVQANANIVIGSSALSQIVGGPGGPHTNVVIGHQAGDNYNGLAEAYRSNVAIGYQSLRRGAAGSSGAPQNNVAIGFQCLSQMAGGAVSRVVAIGSSCLSSQAGLSMSDCVFIGESGGGSANGSSRTIAIGAGTSLPSGGNQDDCVVLGYQATAAGSTNVIIGSSATSGGAVSNGCVVIGNGAGSDIAAATDHKFYIGTTIAATQRCLLFGDFNNGNLVVGKSTTAAGNRNLPGTNILKLINGTISGVAPAGGGFFYASGGELHWVSSGNVDYPLTPGAAGIFTVATLPALPAGSRAFVTDALAPAFGAAVAGGGAVFTTVFRNNAAAWIVG